MSDEQEMEAEEERPFMLSDGDCFILDPEYLPLDSEAEGVLAIQWSLDRGLWMLVGETTAGGYERTWQQCDMKAKPARPRAVQ